MNIKGKCFDHYFIKLSQLNSSWEIFMWISGVEGLNNMDPSLKMDT